MVRPTSTFLTLDWTSPAISAWIIVSTSLRMDLQIHISALAREPPLLPVSKVAAAVVAMRLLLGLAIMKVRSKIYYIETFTLFSLLDLLINITTQSGKPTYGPWSDERLSSFEFTGNRNS